MIQTPLEHSYEIVNGVKLHIVKAGDPQGEPLILLHGFPDFWYGWRHQIDYLTALGYRLWIPDQRGVNLSQKVQGGMDSYHVEHLTADVVGLIDAIGVEKIKLISHDWGALVAWWTALLYPERIERLSVMSAPHPNVFQQALGFNPRQIMRSWYVWLFQLPYIPEWAMRLGNWEIAVEALRTSARESTFTRAELEVYRQAYAQTEAMTCALNYYRAFVQRPRPIPKSWTLSMPVLMLAGTSDRYIEPNLATDSMTYCLNGELHFLDASHWILADARDDVNALLKDFLAKDFSG